MHPPSLIEIIGVVTGAVCVPLGLYENAWTWPVGLASNAALFFLFRRHGVYAAAGLQVLFAALALYGWWNWLSPLRAKNGHAGDPELRGGSHGRKLAIGRTTLGESAALATAAAVGAVALHVILRQHGEGPTAWPDASAAALCLAAQYLLARKLLENWLAWIAADVIYIALYGSKRLYLTAALYCFFLAMCIVGYRRWRRISQQDSRRLPVSDQQSAFGTQPKPN